MSKTAVSIHYHDFHPSEQTKQFIESVVREIHSELPRGATVRATFTLRDKLIKGMLQVGAFTGPIFSVAAAEDLREVTLKLIDQMRRRIDKFKTRMHARKGLKQMYKQHIFDEADGFGTGVA